MYIKIKHIVRNNDGIERVGEGGRQKGKSMYKESNGVKRERYIMDLKGP